MSARGSSRRRRRDDRRPARDAQRRRARRGAAAPRSRRRQDTRRRTSTTRSAAAQRRRGSRPRRQAARHSRPARRPQAVRRRPVRRRRPSLLSRAQRRARPSRRLQVVAACYLLLVLLIAGRLVTVQVVAADTYRALGERQTVREVTLQAGRGALYDRAGSPLAITQSAAAVYGDPALLAEADVDPTEVASELAPLIDRDPQELAARLSDDRGFVYLARQLPNEAGEAVRDAALPGVGVLEEPSRRYPGGSLAASVLGFAGIDDRGLSGLELAYDDVLAGEPGSLRMEQTHSGLPISTAPRQVREPVAGADLLLTLDRRVQDAAEAQLATALEDYDAGAGAAVVLDADTAEVLAMASAPGFDQSEIGSVDPDERRNRAVTDAFEPGSVAKVITAAAAIEHGVVDADEELRLPPAIQVGGKRFRDPHRGETTELSFAEVIARSSNVGTISVAQQLGSERLHDAFADFGYGRPTGLGFPGETSGALLPVDEWWNTSLPTIAIGQGVSGSLLHMASSLQTIAGGGERVEPTLVRARTGPDGSQQPVDPAPRHRVVSPETAATMTELLVGVVDDGTGGNAAVEGYQVAGKTGTAQKAAADRRGYEPGSYTATFAGFAPADDPELVVAVMLEDPEPIWGGQTAAPTFAAIMSEALAARRVAPDLPAPNGGDVPAPEDGDQPLPDGDDVPPPDGEDVPAPDGDVPHPHQEDTPELVQTSEERLSARTRTEAPPHPPPH